MAESLKEQFFSHSYVKNLAKLIHEQHSSFPKTHFIKDVLNEQWEDRELKQRMRHITECLHLQLDQPYTKALEIFRPIAPKLGDFNGMVLSDYVELYGLNEWSVSVDALEHFTQYASAEFAVRPFIIKAPKKMMRQMQQWSKHKSRHVRRLASEGCRPRLPWAMALSAFKQNPEAIIPILTRLKTDPCESVRRSVANNLNDISKDNPNTVIRLSEKWLGKDEKVNWVVKHGCRTLLKQAHPQALGLFGYQKMEGVQVKSLAVDKGVEIGKKLNFSFELSCKRAYSTLGKLRIEFAIDYVKANGSSSRKIFKISEGDYAVKKKNLQRQHSFRQMSTRKHYPGTHRLNVIINGQVMLGENFEVSA